MISCVKLVFSYCFGLHLSHYFCVCRTHAHTPTQFVLLFRKTKQNNGTQQTGLPGVFFFYEISPLHVEIVEGYRKGYIAFFTSVCAIVGGVVTTFGLLDQLMYSQTQKGGARGEGLVQ